MPVIEDKEVKKKKKDFYSEASLILWVSKMVK